MKGGLEVALSIAWQAGNIALDMINKIETVYKNNDCADPVTEADIKSQAIAEKVLQQTYPKDSIVGEEDLSYQGEGSRVWFIDPIDGTNNFCNRRYGWATTLALRENDKTVLSVVYLPAENVVFYADETGAWKGSLKENRNKITVEQIKKLEIERKKRPDEANIGVWISKRRFKKYNNFFNHLLSETSLTYAGVSGAIEISNIADDCLDGWVQADVKLWDYYAAAFIAKQAGAVLLDYEDYRIIANSNELAEHIKAIIIKSKQEELKEQFERQQEHSARQPERQTKKHTKKQKRSRREPELV